MELNVKMLSSDRIRKNLPTPFSQEDNSLLLKGTIVRGIFFTIVTVVMVWFLQPDLFGLVPNSLDPMFYTGYAINLDDALAAAGNRHYFVTRWTSYMPMYLFSEIFGPYWGRLILRLTMIVILSEVMWRFLHRLEVVVHVRFLSIFMLISSPTFVRAFTTDYPEYFIIWGALILLQLSFVEKPNQKVLFVIGALTASLVIANPASLFLVGLTCLNLIFTQIKVQQKKKILFQMLIVTLWMASTVIFGYLLFRFLYNIDNIYQPTIDFIRNASSPAVDGWRAPSRLWIGYFPWIFLPIVLAIVGITILRTSFYHAPSVVLRISVLGLLVFAYHVALEIRAGHMIETSFYFSLLLSPTLLLLSLILTLALQYQTKFHTILFFLSAIILLKFALPQRYQLGSGFTLYVTVVCFVLLLLFLIVTKSKVLPMALLVVVFWMQLGAPTYTQLTNGGDSNTPRYDLVYNQKENISSEVLRETIWFLQEMDQVPNDSESTFFTTGGWSHAIVATYIPHPFSRWFSPGPTNPMMASNLRDEFHFNYRANLVLFGPVVDVAKLLVRLKTELPDSQVIRDATHSENLGYRLVALKGNGGNISQSIYSMNRFERNLGELQFDGSVVVAAGSPQGFVSFGPYFGLGAGDYEITLDFSSEPSVNLGEFEAYNDKTGEISMVPIINIDGKRKSVSVLFESDGPGNTWQIRTKYLGLETARFYTIKLEKLN